MKRKLSLLVFALAVLCLTQMLMAAYACHKEIVEIRDDDGDGIIEVGEYVEIDMWIGISAWFGDDDWEDVMVYDRIAAEWDVIDYSATQGDLVMGTPRHLGKKGKGATLIVWDVGDLTAVSQGGEAQFLYLTIATNLNPSVHRKQRYTSQGTYEINSGATLKCYIEGHKYSEYMNSLYVDVFPPD